MKTKTEEKIDLEIIELRKFKDDFEDNLKLLNYLALEKMNKCEECGTRIYLPRSWCRICYDCCNKEIENKIKEVRDK